MIKNDKCAIRIHIDKLLYTRKKRIENRNTKYEILKNKNIL